MLDFKRAIEILRENGIDSLTSYPLVYKNGKDVGLAYTFDTDHYGNLERVRISDNESDFDLFVKQIKWYREYGGVKRVSLVLDNYEKENPKVMFVHNGEELSYETMLNIDQFDENAKNELEGSDIKRIVFELSRLFSYYNRVKEYFCDYVDSVNASLVELYDAYKILQARIDVYNQFSEVREYVSVPLPTIAISIDVQGENECKDSFNHLKVSDAKYEDFFNLLKRVWALCMKLELNEDYIRAMKMKQDVLNEKSIVDYKLEFMERALSDRGIFRGVKDIVNAFKKLEKEYVPVGLHEQYDVIYRNRVIDKYKRFEEIHVFNTFAYLDGAFLSEVDYGSYAMQFRGRKEIMLDSMKVDMSKVKMLLNKLYERFDNETRDLLLLLNSEYYDFFRMILNIGDYRIKGGSELVQILSANADYQPLLDRCYRLVSELLPFNDNEDVVRVLGKINFMAPEDFLLSLVRILDEILTKVSRVALQDDINVYFRTYNYANYNERIMSLSMDVSSILSEVTGSDLKYVIVKLMRGAPLFYSAKMLQIPRNGESEIRIVDNTYGTIHLVANDIVMDKGDEEVIVSSYRGEVVRDAGYSYVESIDAKAKFCFVEAEISKKM